MLFEFENFSKILRTNTLQYSSKNTNKQDLGLAAAHTQRIYEK